MPQKISEKINIDSPVSSVKGIGPKKAASFKRLNINTIRDVLFYFPRSYEDLRYPKNICDIQNDEKVLVRAVVLMARPGKGCGRKRTLHLLAEDRTGRIEIIFFMAGFMKFETGCLYRFYGKCKTENGRTVMFHPTYEKDDGSEGGIVPVYRLTKGITLKDMRKLSKAALEYKDLLNETLPLSVIEQANICPLGQAITSIHYPEDEERYRIARYRLVFEELFDLKTILAICSSKTKSAKEGISFSGDFAEIFAKALPFEFTAAQSRVLKEIVSDMKSSLPMNRLVQGDVGSGKTAIAQAAIAMCVNNGYQAAFMAPTEILASQHFESLSRDFEPFGINVGLLTGSMPAAERKKLLSEMKDGSINVVVGTHALISKGVEYCNLGLVITDEQHRFGVAQRQKLSAKGLNPDIIVMTATPIPRTLAAVLYADLDVSVIDELPKGRIPIITKHFAAANRKLAYALLLEEVKKGRQAYIVAPLIEDSEEIDGYSAEALYETFEKKYKDVSCALLHGQMKQNEKDEIMRAFYEGRISVLISTVVIEVGINVPNAAVMLIENQERFGLAQLHQLRGRVGRGSYQSYCLLISGEESEISKKRADIMCKSQDGFVIAEKDLEMRGPGEIFGYRQHGLPEFLFADPIKHAKIAEEAGRISKLLLEDDPGLKKDSNRSYREKLYARYLEADNITL